jgi:hypothetical protein
MTFAAPVGSVGADGASASEKGAFRLTDSHGVRPALNA